MSYGAEYRALKEKYNDALDSRRKVINRLDILLIAGVDADQKKDKNRRIRQQQKIELALKQTCDQLCITDEAVSSTNKQLKLCINTIARHAGVPLEFCNNIKIVQKDGENILHIFFGGVDGKPDGPKHGHIVVNNDDRVTYSRPPRLGLEKTKGTESAPHY